MKKNYLLLISLLGVSQVIAQVIDPFKPDNTLPPKIEGMSLVFSEEFNYEGKPDPAIWIYETGYVRNEELQWYQSDNANCTGEVLLIEGRKANFPNPNYDATSSDWRKNRKTVKYTSPCILTRGKQDWMFGRFEIRARLDVSRGAWPAIWTLGKEKEWPSCGEIDLLELYLIGGKPALLSNVAWGTKQQWVAKWDGYNKPLSVLLGQDPDWASKFHTWRMDWNSEEINLYVDDVLFNNTKLSETINGDGSNPFLQPHYMLLNLALGSNAGDPANSKFPITYEVDYVRIYQPIKNGNLVVNGDFSLGKAPWVFNTQDAVVDGNQGGFDGNACRMIGATTERSAKQKVYVEEGKTYDFSFLGRIQNIHSSKEGVIANKHSSLGVATLKGEVIAGDGTSLITLTTQKNVNTTLSGKIVIPQGVSWVELILSKNWNIGYIDDVTLVESTSAQIESPEVNKTCTIFADTATKTARVISTLSVTEVTVSTLQGAIVSKTCFSEYIPMSHCSSGVYIAEVKLSNNDVVIRKFVL